jgi:hypothetical protein
VCEQRDPGDLTTIEDPTALQQIKELVCSAVECTRRCRIRPAGRSAE